MKLGPLALMLGLLVAACHRPTAIDGALRQKLIGTWVWVVGSQGGGGATTLAADGTFVSESTNRWTGGSKRFSYEGTWEIKDGVLAFKHVKTSEPRFMPVGKSDRLQIIRADARELALLDLSENRTNILQRSL